jgi:hypothetical protein
MYPCWAKILVSEAASDFVHNTLYVMSGSCDFNSFLFFSIFSCEKRACFTEEHE